MTLYELNTLKQARELILFLLNENDPAWSTQFDGTPDALKRIDKILRRNIEKPKRIKKPCEADIYKKVEG